MSRATFEDWALGLCDAVAERSRDPLTKVGAIVFRPNHTIASTGYNGFPRGVEDREERYVCREVKYKFVCHAEANAIVTAREPLDGYTLFCSHIPCNECMKLIIQSGIKRIYTHNPRKQNIKYAYEDGLVMMGEAKVVMTFCEPGSYP